MRSPIPVPQFLALSACLCVATTPRLPRSRGRAEPNHFLKRLYPRQPRRNHISEFAVFARTLMPPGADMTEAELRDHADEILTAVVDDMSIAQT